MHLHDVILFHRRRSSRHCSCSGVIDEPLMKDIFHLNEDANSSPRTISIRCNLGRAVELALMLTAQEERSGSAEPPQIKKTKGIGSGEPNHRS